MKKIVVIFATPDVASIVSLAFPNTAEVKHEIIIIDITQKNLLTNEQLRSLVNAEIILVEYNEDRMRYFAKEFADGLVMKNLTDKTSLPVFEIIYPKNLRKTDMLLRGLISGTRLTYLTDLLYPYLDKMSYELLEPVLEEAFAKVVSNTTMEGLLSAFEQAGKRHSSGDTHDFL